jgi:uncharacterized protein (UPF0335 family)
MSKSKKTYPDVSGGDNSSAVAGQQLRAFLERVERMTEEKKAIADDIREIFAEAKGNGFNPKIMRIILRRRGMDKTERDEQDAMVHLYAKAVGDDSPADAGDEDDDN